MDTIVKEVINFVQFRTLKTDNWVFRLHYQITCLLLFGFSILVTSTTFFGEPINCMTAVKYDDGIPEKVINNYCWIHCTFTMPRAYDRAAPWDVIAPGVDTSQPNDTEVYHAYYQWVCFFFAFQGIMFYLPRYMWNSTERGQAGNLVLELDNPIHSNSSQTHNKVEILAKYLKRSSGTYTYRAVLYYLCEVLNFVNVIAQIFLTDRFLGHEFTTYGTEVIQFAQSDQNNRTDPMIKIFPRVTKCSFRQFGVGGSVQNHAALCILPINVINEKLFIFLWFWFVILAIVSGLVVIYRLFFLTDFCKSLRLKVGLPKDDRETIDDIITDPVIDIGDFFLLLILKKNLAPSNFLALITKLKQELGNEEEEEEEDDDDDDGETKNDETMPINNGAP